MANEKKWNKPVQNSRTYTQKQLAAIEEAIESGKCQSFNELMELEELKSSGKAVVKMTLLRTLKGINEKRKMQGKKELWLQSQKNYKAHDAGRYEKYKAAMLQDMYCKTPDEWRKELEVRNIAKYQNKLKEQTGIEAPSAYYVRQERDKRSKEKLSFTNSSIEGVEDYE